MMTSNFPERVIWRNSEWYVRAIMNDETSPKLKNDFMKEVYNIYVNIRIALDGNRCQKMSVFQVKTALKDEEKRQNVAKSLRLSPENLDLVVFIAENYIKMVR